MELKEYLKREELEKIKQISGVATLNIISEYKNFLLSNGLVYEGEVIDFGLTEDGQYVRLNPEFEDFLFKNSTILKENSKIIILIGDDNDNTTRNKTRTVRHKRKDRGPDRE